jgi:MazG family protein
MTTMQEKLAAFERLLNIMDELREKCPWDQKQTLESIRPLTIEETYELSDSIIAGDYPNIRKEIGDLLLHIIFYAKIGSETGHFDISSVINSLNEKLIFRHPHVFKDVEVADDTEVKKNWEQLKIQEGNKSVLGGVPASLPSLIKASRIQEKVRAVGFDWEKREQVWDKVHEEMEEVMEEAGKGNQDGLEDEFGDLLFSVINAARLYNVDPDTALERTNQKFMKRFRQLENEVNARGLDLHKMSLAQMDEIWEEAKKL